MFKKENRYVSREANEIIDIMLEHEHEQEVPKYKEKYVAKLTDVEITGVIKVYVIDSVEYATMILVSEY